MLYYRRWYVGQLSQLMLAKMKIKETQATLFLIIDDLNSEKLHTIVIAAERIKNIFQQISDNYNTVKRFLKI